MSDEDPDEETQPLPDAAPRPRLDASTVDERAAPEDAAPATTMGDSGTDRVGPLPDGSASAVEAAAAGCSVTALLEQQPSRILDAPAAPQILAVGDFDHDGDLDLVVSDRTGRNVSLLVIEMLAGGKPGKIQMLAAALTADDAFTSARALVTDLNGDGMDDLVFSGTRLTTFLNDGTGKLVAQAPIGIAAMGLVAGDLTGDKLPDLAIKGSLVGAPELVWLFVLPNDGAGHFAAFDSMRVAGTDPAGPVLVDLDADGDRDILVAGEQELLVAQNDKGHFALRTKAAVAAVPRAENLIVGDVDGDGDQDVAGRGGIWRNDGGFVLTRIYSLALPPIAFVDLDSDKDLDVVLRKSDDGGTQLSLLWNDGGTAFHGQDSLFLLAPRKPTTTAALRIGVVAADLDLDGTIDLVLTGPAFTGVYLWPGRGLRLPPVTDIPTAVGPELTLAADLDQDGDLDLVTANSSGASATLIRNDGSGRFTRILDLSAGTGKVEGLAARDLDGDGRTDLVLGVQDKKTGGAILVFQNRGGMAFAGTAVYPVRFAVESIAAGDLDDDGDADLAMVSGDGTHVVVMLVNDGKGQFTPAPSQESGMDPGTVALADVDQDGRLDIVTAHERDGTVGVLRRTGKLTFAPRSDLPVGPAPDDLAVGDVDGDGLPEIVVPVSRSQVGAAGPDTVVVLWNSKDQPFSTRTEVPVGLRPRAVALADIDGDGRTDLAVANAASNDVTIVINRGGHQLAGRGSLAGGAEPRGLVAANLDGRCGVDLAITSKGSGSVRIFTATAAGSP